MLLLAEAAIIMRSSTHCNPFCVCSYRSTSLSTTLPRFRATRYGASQKQTVRESRSLIVHVENPSSIESKGESTFAQSWVLTCSKTASTRSIERIVETFLHVPTMYCFQKRPALLDGKWKRAETCQHSGSQTLRKRTGPAYKNFFIQTQRTFRTTFQCQFGTT